MKGLNTMNAASLYEALKNGNITVENIGQEEISELFEYMCMRIERGDDMDQNVFNSCEQRITLPVAAEPEKIMNAVYRRLYCHRISAKAVIRRILIASFAAAIAIAACFGTAYAFGVDVVGGIHTILSDDHTVVYETYNSAYSTAKKTKYSLEYAFNKYLGDYIRPSCFPETAPPVRLVNNGNRDGRIYTLFMETAEGEAWQIFATPADESYLPMGYKFSADYGNAVLDFVCTVSRDSEGVTGYKLYTVYGDVQYTFYLYTSDWAEVKIILENLVIPQ